jgi:hypothetical protein
VFAAAGGMQPQQNDFMPSHHADCKLSSQHDKSSMLTGFTK